MHIDMTSLYAARIRARRIMTALIAAIATILGTFALAMPASAAARVDYTIDGGSLNPDGNTTVNMSGSGFQDVQGGFGGIYVLFGWVSDPTGDSWKPSKGGKTGQDYRYVPDDENNPTGYDVFIAFTGDPTASAANGGSLSADGTWNAKITVPGAKFTSYDRSGNPADVDCTQVQCGIITIGAHGVVNSTNETFTPLSFAKTDAAAATQSDANASATQSNEQAPAATGSTESKTTDSGTGADADTGTTKQNDGSTAASGSSGSTSTGGQDADALRILADALNAQRDDSSSAPSLGIAGGLLLAAAGILGLAIVVLAAGIGGYYAVKSLLLGVSPAALEREMSRREQHAEDVRARETMRRAKRKRRQAERLAREQERLDRARGYTSGDGLSSIGQFAVDEDGRGSGARGVAGPDVVPNGSPAPRTSVAPAVDARQSGAASSRMAGAVNGRTTADAPTQTLAPVNGAAAAAVASNGASSNNASSNNAAATRQGVPAGADSARHGTPDAFRSDARPMSVSTGLRGFFDRHLPSTQQPQSSGTDVIGGVRTTHAGDARGVTTASEQMAASEGKER